MANKTQVITKNLVTSNIISATSRYANSKAEYYGDVNRITLKTYNRKNLKRNPADQFAVIRAGYAYRPDLVSQETYGMPDYWWKIMEYNGMKDILEFEAGKNIVLPADILF